MSIRAIAAALVALTVSGLANGASADRPRRTTMACGSPSEDLEALGTGQRARFFLRRNGTMVDRGAGGGAWAVEVEPLQSWLEPASPRDESTMILRIEQRSGASLVGRPWCATLPASGQPRQAYSLPSGRVAGHHLVLTLLDEPRRVEAPAARQMAIDRLVVWTARHVLSDADGLVTGRIAERIRSADFAGGGALAALAKERADDWLGGWPCAPNLEDVRDRPLADLVCGHLRTYRDELDRLIAALTDERQSDARARLAELEVPSGTAEASQPPEQVVRYYLSARRSRNHSNEMFRLVPVARFEIPLAPDDRLFTVSLSDEERSARGLHGGERVALLVLDVPRGQVLSHRRLRGPSLRSDPARTIAQFMQYIVPLARRELAPQELPAQMDQGLAPLAPLTTRAIWPERLEGGVRNDYVLCRGSSCVTEGDAENVAATLRVSPEDEVQLTLLATGGAVMVPEFEGNSRVELRRDLEAQGPDSVWEVTRRTEYFLPHLSVLLGLRIRDLFLGIGPSVLLMDSDPLRHWQLAVGGRLPGDARNVFVLAHAGFLMHERPVNARIGERFSVPLPAMGEPIAPQLETDTAFSLTLGVSVGINLEGIGDAAQAVAKLFGGGE